MILLRHHMYLTDNSFAGDFSLLSAVFFISRQNFWAGSDFGEEILKGIVQLICQDNSKKQSYEQTGHNTDESGLLHSGHTGLNDMIILKHDKMHICDVVIKAVTEIFGFIKDNLQTRR